MAVVYLVAGAMVLAQAGCDRLGVSPKVKPQPPITIALQVVDQWCKPNSTNLLQQLQESGYFRLQYLINGKIGNVWCEVQGRDSYSNEFIDGLREVKIHPDQMRFVDFTNALGAPLVSIGPVEDDIYYHQWRFFDRRSDNWGATQISAAFHARDRSSVFYVIATGSGVPE
jgi:hypothetical protein